MYTAMWLGSCAVSCLAHASESVIEINHARTLARGIMPSSGGARTYVIPSLSSGVLVLMSLLLGALARQQVLCMGVSACKHCET